MADKSNFEQELKDIINRYSKENGSNTPDFILGEYLTDCLKTFVNLESTVYETITR